jgi:predicted hotdog family 3-hydroxylacyl-ACP dehydratase
MLWINALIQCTESSATATARFEADDFPLADGSVLESALIECVAQTAAAALGQRSQTQGKAVVAIQGMLAGVSDFKINFHPTAGQELVIETRELKRLGPMLRITGMISCDGRIVASGEVTLFLERSREAE